MVAKSAATVYYCIVTKYNPILIYTSYFNYQDTTSLYKLLNKTIIIKLELLLFCAEIIWRFELQLLQFNNYFEMVAKSAATLYYCIQPNTYLYLIL